MWLSCQMCRWNAYFLFYFFWAGVALSATAILIKMDLVSHVLANSSLDYCHMKCTPQGSRLVIHVFSMLGWQSYLRCFYSAIVPMMLTACIILEQNLLNDFSVLFIHYTNFFFLNYFTNIMICSENSADVNNLNSAGINQCSQKLLRNCNQSKSWSLVAAVNQAFWQTTVTQHIQIQGRET